MDVKQEQIENRIRVETKKQHQEHSKKEAKLNGKTKGEEKGAHATKRVKRPNFSF
jgi:hypothetical protein